MFYRCVYREKFFKNEILFIFIWTKYEKDNNGQSWVFLYGTKNDVKWCCKYIPYPVITPLLEECEDDIHTPQNGDLGVLGDSRNFRAQLQGSNTSPWGVLHIIGKLSKCRCRKWPFMGHLYIYSTSYGQKKGQESNWQFDSQPLKVGNQPDPGVCKGSVTHRWKAFKGQLQVFFRPHPNWRSKQKVMTLQSLGSPNQDSFKTPLWESRDKKPFGRAQMIQICAFKEKEKRGEKKN